MSQIKHGEAGNHRRGIPQTHEYMVWAAMIQRCHNPSNPGFKDYGARGIAVADRWRWSFVAFLSDMGRAPSGMQIERLDNDAGYYPGNCKWATRKEQCGNRRRNPLYKLDRAKQDRLIVMIRGGKTQEQVATALGISQGRVSRIVKQLKKERSL